MARVEPGMTPAELQAWLDEHPAWTVDAVAEVLGVTPRAVFFWLAGKRPIPKSIAIALSGPPLSRRRPPRRRQRPR